MFHLHSFRTINTTEWLNNTKTILPFFTHIDINIKDMSMGSYFLVLKHTSVHHLDSIPQQLEDDFIEVNE